MGDLPDVMFVIDTRKEEIAIKEANRLNIPVIAILDTNCDPTGVDLPIPGNDDASRAINLYCDLMSRAVLDGIQAEMTAHGEDVGELAEPPVEDLPAEAKAASKTTDKAEKPKADDSSEKEAGKAEAAPKAEDAAKAETAAGKS